MDSSGLVRGAGAGIENRPAGGMKSMFLKFRFKKCRQKYQHFSTLAACGANQTL
ncbi:hypothetical protein ACIGHN_27880 [Acidovorax sp. NPDC077693]|uniref:hypothetical protein n=1 Tax=Acidovorax sp. NPDC077693 TaxID=3363889 RepID=UPI0037C88ACE